MNASDIIIDARYVGAMDYLRMSDEQQIKFRNSGLTRVGDEILLRPAVVAILDGLIRDSVDITDTMVTTNPNLRLIALLHLGDYFATSGPSLALPLTTDILQAIRWGLVFVKDLIDTGIIKGHATYIYNTCIEDCVAEIDRIAESMTTEPVGSGR